MRPANRPCLNSVARLRRCWWFGFVLSCVASLAQAAPDAETLGKVAAVTLRYANSLGCAVTLDKRNIVPVRLDDRDLFVVLYSIDVGCSGGSAMSRPALAALKRSTYGTFYVRPEYSSPLSTSDQFPAATDRIFLKDGRLGYQGRELGPDDALCCASVRVEGWARFKNGKWVADRRD